MKKLLYALSIIVLITLFSLSGCETVINCDITFNSSGGTQIESITLTANTPLTLPEDPERAGYTFDGWFTDYESYSRQIVNNYIVVNDLNLYAKWTANQYTLSFNSNGGNIIAPITITYDEIINFPEAPILNNYCFGGWFFDNETFTERLLPAVQITEDATVYAEWILFLGTPSYNGTEIEESGINKYTLTLPQESPYYYHNLLTFVPANTDYTYEISNDPEFINNYAMVIITIKDINSIELGTVEINIIIE